jgi:alanine racemase
MMAGMTEPDFEAARVTVRLGAIAANYRTIQGLAGPAVAAAVVKADAYGLGMEKAAPVLAAAGSDSFFVARLAEGVALRKLLPRARIFVLEGAPADAVPALLSFCLIPVLNSLADIAVWSAVALHDRAGGALDAALHVDTGINRLGLPGEELTVLAGQQAKRLKGINPVLVMSHLACSDDADNAMNRMQLERFRAALAMLAPAPASLAASAGVLLGKDYHFDLVRPGVALYGANPSCRGENRFRTAAVVSARVLQVRRIDKGECVGYAATFRAKRPTMIATVANGYADGIPRAASGRGAAAFRGARAPIVGRVSMDILTLDVTDLIEQPRVGDEVELLGDTIGLRDAAQAADTHEYEILTRLACRLPRYYLDAAS